MVRTYVRKSSDESWRKEKMKKAVEKVKSGEITMRRASEVFNVSYSSLQRRVTCSQDVFKRRGGQPVLDEMAEKKFADRLMHLTTRGFRITPKSARKYVFEFVIRHNLKHNFNTHTKMAGEDWFHRFMQRNKQLTIRKPEGLSRAKINGMQEEKVREFYKVLEKIIDDNDLRGRPECIYNQDETGLPLNNRPPNIIATKGSKDVISMNNVERDENATILACMNAAGQFIPPFVLFKGVRKPDDFIIDMPSGTEIVMMEKGRVTEDAFKMWLNHFNCHRTKGKVILILNGHLSHTNLAVVDLCEASEIELVLLPPHTSHTLQPLNVSFFESLKTYYHQQATAWQHSNAGKEISKIVFGDLLKQAWNLSATVENATKGFKNTGMYPLNPNAISAHKFVGDNIADRSHNHLTEIPSTSGNAQSFTNTSTDITNTIKELLPISE